MPKYGRGKFTAHPNYIEYMNFIANHPNYSGMPNAIDPVSGRINWQVSSGKTTSFNKFYQARWQWWQSKADELSVSGTGNSDDRFSITARLIHPSGLRVCRLCGNEWYVGYMYLNALLSKRWNKLTGSSNFQKADYVVKAAQLLSDAIGFEQLINEFQVVFPEKHIYLSELKSKDDIEEFFKSSSYLQSTWLSPGFMANPPDRLDGFHDYDLVCRKKSDPGRSDENLRSYNHDRRAFEWWSEGEWIIADSLYNSAGPGVCSNCGKVVKRISPDHVGPLSCGFKQIPFFKPLCQSCNSSKNRRFTLNDIKALQAFEAKSTLSVASWQVRGLWDRAKIYVTDDNQALQLSNAMRSLQDYYLRMLHDLYERGLSLFLTCFLNPEDALYEVVFTGLDPSTLEYTSYVKNLQPTNLRRSLQARIVRIAFDSLVAYSGKDLSKRKLAKLGMSRLSAEQSQILSDASSFANDILMAQWDAVMRKSSTTGDEKQQLIAALLETDYINERAKYNHVVQELINHFRNLGHLIAQDIIVKP